MGNPKVDGGVEKIDETTLSIIRLLRDGRTSFKQIADQLSMCENTIRSRVKRLQAQGAFEVMGIVDPEALPGHNLVLIGVTMDKHIMLDKAEEFTGMRGVVSVNVVTGQYDLILLVLVNKEFGLLEFFTEEMARHLDGVRSMESFVVYKGFNMKVPYVL